MKPEVDEGDEFETSDTPDDEASTTASGEKSYVGLTVIVGSAVGASVFGAALFFLFVSRQKKQKTSKTMEKEVIAVDDLNADKPSSPFDDGALEEGRNLTVRRFIFSSEHIADDVTCGLSETNNTSYQNVSQKVSSTFVIDDQNKNTMFSFPDQQFGSNIHYDDSYINTNSGFKINDGSESSFDPEDGTGDAFGFRIDGNADDKISVGALNNSFDNPSTTAGDFQGTMDIPPDDIHENHSELVTATNFSTSTGRDVSLDNDESDSFEEIEVESDDEIQEDNAVTFVNGRNSPNSSVENGNYDNSSSVVEYEDASDEEIEVSVHDDDEFAAMTEFTSSDNKAEISDETDNSSEASHCAEEVDVDISKENYCDADPSEEIGRKDAILDEDIRCTDVSAGDLRDQNEKTRCEIGHDDKTPESINIEESSHDDWDNEVDDDTEEEVSDDEEETRGGDISK